MVFNSVSETETPPQNPSPPPPPPPPPPMSSFIFSAKSHPLHHNLSSFSNLRWSLNHSNPNRLLTSPENHHLPLSPLHHNPSPHNKLGDWDLRLGGGSGFRLGSGSGFELGEPGLNPVLRLGPSLPNPTENNNSPGSGDTDPDEPVSDDGGVGKGVEKPVEPVEVSEKKVGEKGKSKISVRFPERNKGSGSGSGYATDGDEAEAEADTDPEADLSFEDEDLNFVKAWSLRDDEERNFVKTWNLRPRKEVTKPPPNVNNGGGSRNGGRPAQASRPKPVQASRPKPVQASRPKPVQASRPKPAQARARAAAAAPEEKAAAAQKKPMFSLTLKKEEIEEDFLRMTGAKPPKKPTKRTRAVQKQLDACFPGVWLRNVTPDLYRVPDPPLKG